MTIFLNNSRSCKTQNGTKKNESLQNYLFSNYQDMQGLKNKKWIFDWVIVQQGSGRR